MQVEVVDQIDLEKIRLSGQAFRIAVMPDGRYRFICRNNVVYIRQLDGHTLDVSCKEDDWNNIWIQYFDLSRSYDTIINECYGKHPYVDHAMDCGRGLRILRQDPWEMLITFIISQRKSIPAIAGSVEAICRKYGTIIDTEIESLHLFPTPEQMTSASAEELADCSLGYRVSYVLDAIDKVLHKETDPDALQALDDEMLLAELMSIRGVGVKVANCVALFAYGRIGCVPIDVHINNAIEKCGGSPFELYGENAGIMQQYIFYYEKNGKD